MLVNYRAINNRITFEFLPTSSEKAKKGAISLGNQIANVDLPYDVGNIHPDILGLCAFLIAGSFAEERLTFQTGISPQFAEALSRIKPNLEIGPINHELVPRKRPDTRKPGLCFSGGADSTAAMEILPEQTELFFVKRVPPKHKINMSLRGTLESSARKLARFILNRKTIVKSSEAGERFCALLRESGRQAFAVETDLEYVRDPVGFPHNIACTVPLLLMAEARNLDAVAWGTIAEAGYQIGSGIYVDFMARDIFRRYNPLFSTVGLPFLNPVVGLSEVATSRIAMSSHYRSLVQSCQREAIEPCGCCIKCFRKRLLEASVTGEWPNEQEFDQFFSDPNIKKTLQQLPIKLENVYTFVASKYTGKHPVMLALKKRLRADVTPVDWMTRYIPSLVDQAPLEYRQILKDSLARFLEPMSDEDIRHLQSWDLRDLKGNPEVLRLSQELQSVMNKQRRASAA